MKRVELYGRVRHAVMIEGLSQREAARCFGIDPRTVRKMLSYSVPPGYVRTRPPVRPKLDPFIGIIDRILEEDKDRPKKQRHTSKRIFERLRDEYGFTGKITIVKDYICGVRQRRREMFVPLTHPPGHAQVDFGEALAVIGGVERKIHFLAMSLPHSDACFVKAYPGETTEAFCDGHVSGFSFFGGVPRSILYDNTRIAVARILGDGKRQRTRVFSELRSHYLFEDRFGRPGKGNDKGKVEGIVGYCRRNFVVPMPRFRNFDDLNTHLEACCAKRWAEQLRGHDQTVNARSLGIEYYDDGDWKRLDDRYAANTQEAIAARFFIKTERGPRPLHFGRERWATCLNAYLLDRTIDPFINFLEGLPTWDGQDRLDLYMGDIFGCDEGEIERWVSRFIFVGTIQRAYEPGCMLREMPILIGAQRIGKSALTRAVLPPGIPGLHSDGLRWDAPPERQVDATRGRAIVEVSEMAGRSRAQIEYIKAFISLLSG